MTRIDFYLLSSDQLATRLQYACRLAHKAWQKGHRVYLHCQDETAAEQLGFFSRFSRLAEIVVEQDPVRVPARERFRFYRERGYPLQTHQIRTAG